MPFMLEEKKRPKTEERQSQEEAVTAGCVNTLDHASVRRDIKGGQEANGPSLKRPQDLLVPHGKQAQMSKTSLRKTSPFTHLTHLRKADHRT